MLPRLLLLVLLDGDISAGLTFSIRKRAVVVVMVGVLRLCMTIVVSMVVLVTV